jgi:hypothetical protein
MICNTPAELINLSRNFMGSRILLTGAELNIFDILNQTSLTVQEASDKLHTDIRATTILFRLGPSCKEQRSISMCSLTCPVSF